jgi:plasmid stabilization system protein ParE
MRVRFTPRARNDIAEIFAYIAKDNAQAAHRVRQAIFATIALVAARRGSESGMRGHPNCEAIWWRAIRTASTIRSVTRK